jgi:UDP-2,3-diacylglucosamine pyrophosphatase LpxH
MKVVKHITGLVSKGVKVYYVTGNHDEMLRKFAGFRLGSFSIVNKLLLDLHSGEKAWVFHGDVFDVTMRHSKWLARLGATGYDLLILLNRSVNFLSERVLHKGKISLSARIKRGVKQAVSYIEDFEHTAAQIGMENGYHYVVCGHIHQPCIREINGERNKRITYLNSGDWIENLTALEYISNQWRLYHYQSSNFAEGEVEEEELTTSELFKNMMKEFDLMKAT